MTSVVYAYPLWIHVPFSYDSGFSLRLRCAYTLKCQLFHIFESTPLRKEIELVSYICCIFGQRDSFHVPIPHPEGSVVCHQISSCIDCQWCELVLYFISNRIMLVYTTNSWHIFILSFILKCWLWFHQLEEALRKIVQMNKEQHNSRFIEENLVTEFKVVFSAYFLLMRIIFQ